MELKHKCSYGTECIEMAIKIAKERDTGRKRTEEEVHEDIRTSVQEAARMLIQARLGLNLQRRQEQRLLWGNQSKRIHIASEEEELVSGYSWTTEDVTKHEVSNTKTMLWEKAANVISLAGLKIFPKLGEQVGESILGTLEVHVNGFYYATSSPNLCFSFFYADVQRALFRLGDEKAPPLLHFRFHHRIKVGTKKRRNIQFRLVQTRAGQKRSYNDSYNKINEDLKNFIHNVGKKWRGVPLVNYFPFNEAEVCKADEFQGNRPSKAPTVFGLTFSTLVGLVDEPFIVVDLGEIEVVHMRLKPELSKPTSIDMTVVLRDLARDLVQINSIPIDKLDFIKDRCNIAGVKYYENDYDIYWGSIRKEIADPHKVADWRCFEKPETRNYYNAGHPVYCSPYGEAYCGSDNEEASDLED